MKWTKWIGGAALGCAILTGTVGAAAPSADPEDAFRSPPLRAKTGVWWHWMGCNVTRDGIVRDLDWFREVGVGSATIFGMADVCTPWATSIPGSRTEGLVAFTPAWWELVRFACEEAEKRGVELGLHNCPGYTSTGGPWIPPRLAMRELVFNVTNAEAQISLTANADFPVHNEDNGRFEKPDVPARRTDIRDVATVGGVRVQHIPMGAFVQPAQWEAFGLECDKMSKEAVEFHLDHVIGDMKRFLGDQLGRGLRFVLLDSYEAGRPTWTPRMREEFTARRGYDPLPYLPVLGGFKVADAAAEKKFRDDYDRTIKDLYRDVLFKTMREKLNAAGLEFACEPYSGPFDSRECSAHVDRLMTEFWFEPKRNRGIPGALGWNRWTGPDGRRHNVVEAEAFTGQPSSCQWTETPYLLKACGDWQFARGVNRFVLHTTPLQPWEEEIAPGMTMGRWGTHFGRTQTWAMTGAGWFAYLNRCQALLQWGEPSDAVRLAIDHARLKGTPVSSLSRVADGACVFFIANHVDRPVAFDAVPPAQVAGRSPEWFDPVTGRVTPLVGENGRVPLSMPACGSGFLVYRRAIADVAATAESEFVQKGVPAVALHPVSSPWRVTFPGQATNATAVVDMAELSDWTKSADARIRHFSGTATYRTSFACPASAAANAHWLSLGDCQGQVARATLNGRCLGAVWCDPYVLAIPQGTLKTGVNELEVEFTNVWANRLIGDECEPSDCEFANAPYPGGWYLKRFPEWFVKKTARPSSGRACFATWNYFTKDSPLVPSGLLGPVDLR